MSTFAQRHEPRVITDFVFNDPTTETLVAQYAQCKRDGNIILHGPYGTGKSKLALAIVQTRIGILGSGIFDTYHPSQLARYARDIDENTFDKIVNGTWAAQHSRKGNAYCVIDEIDQLSKPLQQKLRAFMDQWANFGNFIMTTNHVHAIDDGIRSRSREIEIPLADLSGWQARASAILAAEGVTCSTQQLVELLSSSNGSVRDILRALEDACVA